MRSRDVTMFNDILAIMDERTDRLAAAVQALRTEQAEHFKLGHADAHESDMTKDEAQTILSTGQPCDWCGRYHAAMTGCNCLSEMTMDASGKPNHVKFRPEGTWKPQGLSADDLARVIARG